MLHRYEVPILTVPEITQDETKNLEASIERIVRDAKGSIISMERWGKYRLEYPVRKNEYGVRFLVRFEIPEPKALDDLRALFMIRFNDIVMRHMVAVLDLDAPLAYQRPRSLEEAPTGREGMFNRDRGHDRDSILDEGKGMNDGLDADMQETEE